MTIEEILAGLQAIIDGAKGADGVERPLTDEEVQRYEDLEKTLQSVRSTGEIQKRNRAYNTPVRTDQGAAGTGQVNAVAEPTEEERAFDHYLRTGQINGDLQYRAQAEGSGPAGGYLVPDALSTKIIERLKAFGGIAADAEHIPTATGNPLPWPTNDDTDNVGVIVPENTQAASGADLTFGIKTLGAYKYEAVGLDGEPLKVPWELAQDNTYNLEGFIERKLTERIRRGQAPHWVSGTGINQPQGALTGGVSSDQITTNATGISYAELVAAEMAVDIAYLESGKCKWYMSQGVWGLVRQLEDDNGRPLVGSSTDGITGKPERTLLGYPVVLDNAFPATWTAAGKTIIFGDLHAGYVIRDVKEVTILVLRELFARTGQIGYMAWARADGVVQDPYAYTVISAAN